MWILKIIQSVIFTVFIAIFYILMVALSLVATLIRFRGFANIAECNRITANAIKMIWRNDKWKSM